MMRTRIAVIPMLAVAVASTGVTAHAAERANWTKPPAVNDRLLDHPHILTGGTRGSAGWQSSTAARVLSERSYLAMQQKLDPSRADWPAVDFSRAGLIALRMVESNGAMKTYVESVDASRTATFVRLVESRCECVAAAQMNYPYALIEVPKAVAAIKLEVKTVYRSLE